VIVDSEARIKFTTKIMRSCNIISTVIAVSHKATNSKLEKIKSRGASVLVCGMNNKVYLKKLLKILKNIGVNRLLVEGGGEINWSMLTNGLVDEIIVTIAPTIVGGRSAITLVEGIGFTKVNNSLKLKLQKIRKIDSEVILYYKIIN